MLLLEVNTTELRTARLNDAICIIMKKGQMSLSVPITSMQLRRLIEDLQSELVYVERNRVIPRSEWKENMKDKYGDKEDI